MAYKCQKCEAQILVLRVGYCSNCREPIPSDVLPESKKQKLIESEREYLKFRDLARAENDEFAADGSWINSRSSGDG
jgi:predicted amidophosphoribosyltransferase